MYFTFRERNLLQLLTGPDRHWTVKELAETLDVSERTIHRDLAALEATLDGFGLTLRRKAGVGVFLEGNPAGEKALRASLTGSRATDYSQKERQKILLATLLDSSEPIKLAALSKELGVTPATISQDLDGVKKWLSTFNLSLIKKRGWGVQIIGTENNRRSAMRNLLAELFNEADLFSHFKDIPEGEQSDHANLLLERLLGLVEKEKITRVEKVLKKEVETLPYTLAGSSYSGLVVHLALALERIEKGEAISFHPELVAKLRETEEYPVASRIAEQLKREFGWAVPESEIANIALHLRGAKLGDDRNYWFDGSGLALEETAELVRRIGEKTGVSLEGDSSLMQGLLAHLERAIFRLEEGLPIHNPLLPRIQKDYPDLFKTVGEVVKEIFPEYQIPQEEIGYLVMHFGAAIERRKREQPLHALVVCASGIGTSRLLASRLQREFPEITWVHTASLTEWEKPDTRKYDLILSTIPLEMEESKYIRVHPYLTEKDIERIHKHLQARSTREDQKPWTKPTEADAVEIMDQLKRVLETALNVIHGFSLTRLPQGSLLDSLTEACIRLESKGILRNPSTVAKKMLERERRGGLGIPGTGLGLFHARSADVLQPSFTQYVLDTPLEVEGMDGNRVKITNLLVLLAPEEGEEKDAELLSRISVLTVEAPSIFQSKDEEKIRGFLAEKLYRTLLETFNE
jgi:mannitol operon transcriptional antiterminator